MSSPRSLQRYAFLEHGMEYVPLRSNLPTLEENVHLLLSFCAFLGNFGGMSIRFYLFLYLHVQKGKKPVVDSTRHYIYCK